MSKWMPGGRKWTLIVLCIAVSAVLAFFDKLTGEFVTILLGLAGSYVTANTVQAIREMRTPPKVPDWRAYAPPVTDDGTASDSQ